LSWRKAVENLRDDAPREAIRRISQSLAGFKARGRGWRVVPMCRWIPWSFWIGRGTSATGGFGEAARLR